MSLWASQRKLAYSLVFVVLLLIALGVPAFFFLYEKPSCVDGKQNQGELGVDCGGVCRNLCQAKQSPPIVVWAQKFKVAEGRYSIAAYIENPNVSGSVNDVPYTFTLYDNKASFIIEKKGTAYIPAGKSF